MQCCTTNLVGSCIWAGISDDEIHVFLGLPYK